ncbi:MAG TPA: bifunctional UDP-3-O-[3-hydroxymyristoyl] N-acetylglucosamine deacetylase/3-hydroxyacyl-ACP dehydratase [Bacteroidales bacterium]|nr:bifunctional UDP-3-O-[3-hydroxymyristoyl] N-acetylglucosamine deacetylase/3-hydroxyacyl-ACP dehydratase [Bacteroidales bacterium]
MSDKQCTLARPVTVTGTGLHTGHYVNMTFHPAPADHGYRFRRIDIEGQPEVPADLDYVVDTSRGTTLEKDGARVSTVEHTLSALYGIGIDNCLIEIDGPETPIMDGSARLFVEALEEAGTEEQEAERKVFEIRAPLSYAYPDKHVEMFALPSSSYEISVMIDFETRVLGTQHARMHDIRDFREQIAPCRTFVFLHELEYLLKNDLIRGGDLSNAIVFMNRAVSQEELDRLATLFRKPSVAVKEEGILNNLDLYFRNEPARHKLLDVVGDLALLGVRLKGHIIANRPGHHTNVEFGRLLRKQMKQESKSAPAYDPNAEPVYDINQIQSILPHRPPFLLVDKILDMGSDYVVGLKNVTMNEPFFVGHFPGEPVMPGVLQIEAMAQAGGILALSSVPDPEHYTTYFLKIDKVRFRHKVVPGDTLIFTLKLLAPIRRGIVQMEGVAYVGQKVVMEAEMMAQIVRNPNT